MKKICEDKGYELSKSWLIDDRSEQISSAIVSGANGFLVEHCYNLREVPLFKARHRDSFLNAKHTNLVLAVETATFLSSMAKAA